MSAGHRPVVLVPFSEDHAERVARIIGSSSAAAQALIELEQRRNAGEEVGLFRTGDSLVVGPYPSPKVDRAKDQP